jgi:hypothetical protein
VVDIADAYGSVLLPKLDQILAELSANSSLESGKQTLSFPIIKIMDEITKPSTGIISVLICLVRGMLFINRDVFVDKFMRYAT